MEQEMRRLIIAATVLATATTVRAEKQEDGWDHLYLQCDGQRQAEVRYPATFWGVVVVLPSVPGVEPPTLMS
jgi:hypothetical protein